MTAVRQYTFGCRERQIKIDRDEMGFVGPFAHFFRTHAKDLDGATTASTFGSGLLAATLDELLQHLADNEKSIEGFYSIDVEASSEVLKVLEDTSNPPRGFYNVVVTTYAKTPAAMVHISVLEQYDELGDAMEAGSDREGGSGSVWVIDLNTLDVTFRSVAAVNDRPGTVERAVELLKPYGAAMWHSGGGIMLARIDLPDQKRELMVSESEVSPGRFWLGIYPLDDRQEPIEEETQYVDLLTSTKLVAHVKELVEETGGSQ